MQKVDFNNIPKEIKDINNWVLWKLETRKEKKTKIPYQINGKMASSKNPNTWTTFNKVIEIYNHRRLYSGIGFMFSGSGITGIDIDHCIEDNIISDKAENIIELLNSYTEKSQSGNGIHILVKGSIPKAVKKEIEMYDNARYFTVTGNKIHGNEIEYRQQELNKLYKKYQKNITPQKHSIEKFSLQTNNIQTDSELLEKAFDSKEGNKIKALFNGDISRYNNDQSRADQALCNYLAFWFDKDFNSIDQVFRKSGLYRDKWEREDYRNWTINKAINDCNKSYQELREQIPVSKTNEDSNIKYYDLNDYGNGQRLVDTYHQNIKFCNEWQSWMIYNGHRWVEDNYGALQRMAKNIIEQIREEALNELNENKQKSLLKAVAKTGNIRGIKGMIESASTEKIVRINSEKFDQNKNLLNFKNGTFDLEGNKFRENKTDDYITKVININYEENAFCPRWKQFINEIMNGNKNLVSFIQRAIGYSLTGSTKEQKMFICYGIGSNGKSIMMEILRFILNDYSRNIAAESLMLKENKNSASGDIARLKGARFVTAKENKEGRKLDEALIKEATGADTITARYLYKNEFEFMPEFKLWLATNHKPEITGTDDGIWRRLILIPFNVQFTDQKGNKDPNLLDKLKAEAKGIINWCIEGYNMWNKQGLNPPSEVIKAVEEYRSESDTMQQFINECLVVAPNACITNKELTDLYNYWSGKNITTTKFSISFKEKAKKLNLTQTRKSYGNFWKGIGKAVKEDFKQEPFI